MDAPNMATDCIHYEEFMGNDCCRRFGINLNGGDVSPCMLCKFYIQKGENGHEDFKAVADRCSDSGASVCDSTGQYYILGM